MYYWFYSFSHRLHNFVGAKAIYNNDYVWNTINEAVSILQDKNYNSKEYFKFIKDNYSIEKELNSINELLVLNKNNSKDNFKNKPLVTVGITNYNGKQYLEKCIESFLNQTYSNIEILLIDDCSTDESKEIIQKYEKDYKNIKGIYHEVNSGGASKGIQEIIENANGKYYQWIACDDFVEKNTVEMFVGYLEKNQGKDYVYSNFNIVDETDKKTGEWNYKVLDSNNAIQHIFCNASGIIPMNCMYRIEFFRKNKLNWLIYRDNDFSADTLNTLQFIKYNWQYGKIDKSLINYRIHSSNLSHSLEKRIKTSISVFDYIIKNFKEEVYFPHVEWKNAENKVQLKNYLIANFYYEQILKHLSMEVIPTYLKSNVTKEDLAKYCYAFIEEGMSYINDGLKQGNTYKAKLNDLKEKYESYME
jgi:glycosyltransferase involved in cell wall biosynthesis